MHGDGTDGIVDLEAIKADDGKHHQHTTDQADEHGKLCAGAEWVSGDGHKARQGTIERHGEVCLAEERPSRQERRYHAAAGSKVGVDEDLGDGVGLIDVGKLELRAAVKAEPAEPKDEGTERC